VPSIRYPCAPQTTTNASPTGTAKTGSYETTFVINQSGQISAVSAVPEPSTDALLGLGAVAVAFTVRRRQAKACKPKLDIANIK